MTGSDRNGAKARRPGPPLLEWIAAAVGLVLTLGILGAIGWEALKGTSEERPPSVEATVEQVTPAAAGYVVEVLLRNHSPSTAASVEVQGDLKSGGTTIETSGATIDYVPGESSRRAGLFFTKDPHRYELEIRALGYAYP